MGHVAYTGEEGNAHRFLDGKKPKGKGQLGRPKSRWEGNIKLDLSDIGGGYVYWIRLVRGNAKRRAVVQKVMNFRVL